MPDQPDDPIHYDMKIPPEPKDATLNKQEQHSGSDEVTAESNKLEQDATPGDEHTKTGNPSQSSSR